jgi:hypothetical protein
LQQNAALLVARELHRVWLEGKQERGLYSALVEEKVEERERQEHDT